MCDTGGGRFGRSGPLQETSTTSILARDHATDGVLASIQDVTTVNSLLAECMNKLIFQTNLIFEMAWLELSSFET